MIGPTVAWKPNRSTRFGVSALFGVTHDSPRVQVFAVFSLLFGTGGSATSLRLRRRPGIVRASAKQFAARLIVVIGMAERGAPWKLLAPRLDGVRILHVEGAKGGFNRSADSDDAILQG